MITFKPGDRVIDIRFAKEKPTKLALWKARYSTYQLTDSTSGRLYTTKGGAYDDNNYIVLRHALPIKLKRIT